MVKKEMLGSEKGMLNARGRRLFCEGDTGGIKLGWQVEGYFIDTAMAFRRVHISGISSQYSHRLIL